MRSPVRFLFFVLLAVIGLKASEQVYRYFAFQEERQQMGVLQDRLLDAGARLEQLRVESRGRRDALTAEDARLEEERGRLMKLQRGLERGPMSDAAFASYRRALEDYNLRVVAHNRRVQEYQAVFDRSSLAIDRYLSLGDSVRDLAREMGEPYYAVPTSLEAAVARGVIDPGN